MAAFRTPQPTIATTSATATAATSETADGCVGRWKTETMIVADSIPPIMKTSPWAKLISSRMP